MIPKKLSDITLDDIQRLKTEQVREGKTIEYKSEFPPTKKNSDKISLLKGISALANTSGGDFILGVQAQDGIPTDIEGIKIDNVDKEILKLEGIIKNGCEPHLVGYDIKSILVKDDNYVLIIRIQQSCNAPHRVKDHSRFYGRNSAGKYELDVSELRLAFTLSEQVSDRIRNFRAERMAKVYGNETPVPLMEGGKLLLHIVPLSAFTTKNSIDISVFYPKRIHTLPTIEGGCNPMLNIDGVINYSVNLERTPYTYTLLFRRGIIEIAYVFIPIEKPPILDVVYEQDILAILPRYLNTLSELEIQPPFYLFLSMVGIKDYKLGRNQRYWGDVKNAVDRDVLQLPEIVIDSSEVNSEKILKESFDMIWNAFGFTHSFNYDEKGNWQGQR